MTENIEKRLESVEKSIVKLAEQQTEILALLTDLTDNLVSNDVYDNYNPELRQTED
jgi:hypothetical protein